MELPRFSFFRPGHFLRVYKPTARLTAAPRFFVGLRGWCPSTLLITAVGPPEIAVVHRRALAKPPSMLGGRKSESMSANQFPRHPAVVSFLYSWVRKMWRRHPRQSRMNQFTGGAAKILENDAKSVCRAKILPIVKRGGGAFSRLKRNYAPPIVSTKAVADQFGANPPRWRAPLGPNRPSPPLDMESPRGKISVLRSAHQVYAGYIGWIEPVAAPGLIFSPFIAAIPRPGPPPPPTKPRPKRPSAATKNHLDHSTTKNSRPANAGMLFREFNRSPRPTETDSRTAWSAR